MRVSTQQERVSPPELSLDGNFSIGNKAEVEVPKTARCFTLVPNQSGNDALIKLASENDDGVRVSVTFHNVENADSTNSNPSAPENASEKSLRLRSHSMTDSDECMSFSKVNRFPR